MKAKFDNDILLKLLMQEIGITSKVKLIEKYTKMLDLDSALYIKTDITECKGINSKTNEPLHKKEEIYSTSTAIVKTTQHGRIIDVEFRRKPKPKTIVDMNKRKTIVVTKKRKIINKI